MKRWEACIREGKEEIFQKCSFLSRADTYTQHPSTSPYLALLGGEGREGVQWGLGLSLLKSGKKSADRTWISQLEWFSPYAFWNSGYWLKRGIQYGLWILKSCVGFFGWTGCKKDGLPSSNVSSSISWIVVALSKPLSVNTQFIVSPCVPVTSLLRAHPRPWPFSEDTPSITHHTRLTFSDSPSPEWDTWVNWWALEFSLQTLVWFFCFNSVEEVCHPRKLRLGGAQN